MAFWGILLRRKLIRRKPLADDLDPIDARILDIPTIRPHKLSFGAISRQSPVIVQLVVGAVVVYLGLLRVLGVSWRALIRK